MAVSLPPVGEIPINLHIQMSDSSLLTSGLHYCASLDTCLVGVCAGRANLKRYSPEDLILFISEQMHLYPTVIICT